MFQVVHKNHNTLDTGFLENWESVYDVKRDLESNKLMFLFYSREESTWEYRDAADYEPIGLNEGVYLR